MSLAPPGAKGALLPWRLLPPWLRLVRVLAVSLWVPLFLCLTAMFGLQFQVTASPTVPTGAYEHAVRFKGVVRYLSEPLFSVWSSLDRAWMPFSYLTFLLFGVDAFFEDRIQRRRWAAFLDEVAERMGTREQP